MKEVKLHGWQNNIVQAKDIQQRLAKKVSRRGEIESPKYIAGVDIAAGRVNEEARAAVVLLSYPEMQIVEVETEQARLEIPYIPGFLSFRELPLILVACRKLSYKPDLIMVDGQGIAHPRRLGLASHLGVLLDVATIGCAKSRLCGSHTEPGDETGEYAQLVDDNEIIGAVLRTRSRVKALYISTGHKIGLENAVYWVMQCCRGYRLPQPTRLAHLAAGGNLKMDIALYNKGNN
ncbi:deoxyribonuclease V [Chloroflexota bacterium]